MDNNLREGSPVSYVGSGRSGRVLGERGRILSISGRSGHVKWADATLTLENLDDVVLVRSTVGAARVFQPRDDLDDSLDVGPIHTTSVRDVFTHEGSPGVLKALASTGQLSGLTRIAEETRLFVESRVRQDPDLGQVVAQLDPDDADELVSITVANLLRDASGTENV